MHCPLVSSARQPTTVAVLLEIVCFVGACSNHPARAVLNPCSLDPLQQKAGICGPSEPAGCRRGRRPGAGLAAPLPDRQGGREGAGTSGWVLTFGTGDHHKWGTVRGNSANDAQVEGQRVLRCADSTLAPSSTLHIRVHPHLPAWSPLPTGGQPAVQHPSGAVRGGFGAHGPAQVCKQVSGARKMLLEQRAHVPLPRLCWFCLPASLFVASPRPFAPRCPHMRSPAEHSDVLTAVCDSPIDSVPLTAAWWAAPTR